MVQIIEENRSPSLSERFGKAFSNASRSAVNDIPKYMMEKEQQKIAEQQRKSENDALQQLIGKDLSAIQDPKIRQAFIDMALQNQSQEQKGMSEFNREQSLLKQKQDFERESSSLKGPSKEDLQKQEEDQVRGIAQKSFNTLSKILRKGNVGRGSNILGSLFGGERAKDVGQFTSATGGLEAMLVDMVSKGTLSDARFKYITNTLLPKPNDSDSEIEGKLRGLAEILGLDDSSLTGESTSKEEKKRSLEDIFG